MDLARHSQNSSINAIASPEEETCLERFNHYFRTVTENSLELVRQAQEIRYQVYCLEHKFENPAEHPDGLESDEFDNHSVHSLLIHRASGKALGTVRLVLPRSDVPEESFAIQRVIKRPATPDEYPFPISSTAEVSRFSVSKEFRRRKTDGSLPGENISPSQLNHSIDRRHEPLMSLGLIQTLVRMSYDHGITHWCAVMEPKLLRMLEGMAIHFTPIDGTIEYHGLRQPCYCHIDTVLKRVKNEKPAFWEVLTDNGRLWTQSPSEDFASFYSEISRKVFD